MTAVLCKVGAGARIERITFERLAWSFDGALDSYELGSIVSIVSVLRDRVEPSTKPRCRKPKPADGDDVDFLEDF